MEDSRLTQEDLDYFKSLPLEVQEEFIRKMTYARIHANMTSEVPIWEKDQEIERLSPTIQKITKRTKEMQLSHQDVIEYPEEELKEANEREQKLSLETVKSKKESVCAEDIDTSDDPSSQPRHSHVENLEAVRKEDLEQGFACDYDALWSEKLSKEIKVCLLKHKSSFLRFEKTILESEVRRSEVKKNDTPDCTSMKENPESLHYQCDSLRKQQDDLSAMKEAESQLFADLSTNFDMMQKLLDEIMDRWAALNGPAQAIEFENVMKEYKDRIEDLNVLLEKHTSKSMPKVQTQLDNLKLENDKLTTKVKRLQQESTQKVEETHLNLVKKLEGRKLKISNQATVINGLQKIVGEQKEKLQAQEHDMDELNRAHEELKLYTEKFKPLIVAGAKLRNRRMEKTKPWKDQDTRVKEIGNAAAHDADVIADALLYESDLPFPRRIDSEYFEAHYGYDHRNVIETFSPKLSQVISWNATMNTIATYGCVDDDEISKFKEAFAKIMLVSYGDDDFDVYVTETYEGVSLYMALKVEFDKVVAINSERRAGSKKENNMTSRKEGRNSTKKAHVNV